MAMGDTGRKYMKLRPGHCRGPRPGSPGRGFRRSGRLKALRVRIRTGVRALAGREQRNQVTPHEQTCRGARPADGGARNPLSAAPALRVWLPSSLEERLLQARRCPAGGGAAAPREGHFRAPSMQTVPFVHRRQLRRSCHCLDYRHLIFLGVHSRNASMASATLKQSVTDDVRIR